MFKISVEKVKNAASLRETSKFEEFYHTTSTGSKVSIFAGDTRVINDLAADL